MAGLVNTVLVLQMEWAQQIPGNINENSSTTNRCILMKVLNFKMKRKKSDMHPDRKDWQSAEEKKKVKTSSLRFFLCGKKHHKTMKWFPKSFKGEKRL